MAISQQDYQLRQGEGIDAYNARIAALRATSSGSTTATAKTVSPTATTLTASQKAAASQTLGNVTKQLQDIQSKVAILKQAEQAGLTTTGKTVQQLQAEMQTKQASVAPTTVTPTATAATSIASPVSDTFSQQLFDKLSKQLDIVSSQDTEYTKAVQGIIDQYKTAETAQKSAIEASYATTEEEVQAQGAQNVMAAREQMSGLGAASTFALLDRVNKSTETSLRDLESRKQEALATGQMEVADKIASLQLQQLEYQQQAQQQAFSNLLSVGNLGVSLAQTEQQKQYQEKSLQLEQNQQAFSQAVQALQVYSEAGVSPDTGDISNIATTLGIPSNILVSAVSQPNKEVVNTFFNSNDGTITVLSRDKNTGEISAASYDGGTGTKTSDMFSTLSIDDQDVALSSYVRMIESDILAGVSPSDAVNNLASITGDTTASKAWQAYVEYQEPKPTDETWVSSYITQARSEKDDVTIKEELKAMGTPDRILEQYLPEQENIFGQLGEQFSALGTIIGGKIKSSQLSKNLGF